MRFLCYEGYLSHPLVYRQGNILLIATHLQRNQVNTVFTLGIVLKASDHRCFLARVRNGFVPASRRQVFEKIRPLVSPTMPFVNLPDEHPSRWGENLTADKMKECVWLRPEAVAQVEFLEWTAGDRLRHSTFVGLREDKSARLGLRSTSEKPDRVLAPTLPVSGHQKASELCRCSFCTESFFDSP